MFVVMNKDTQEYKSTVFKIFFSMEEYVLSASGYIALGFLANILRYSVKCPELLLWIGAQIS